MILQLITLICTPIQSGLAYYSVSEGVMEYGEFDILINHIFIMHCIEIRW